MIPAPLRTRTLETRDLEPVDALLRAAYAFEASFLPRVHRYMAVEREGWVVAERSDAIVGVGFFAAFGRCGYIGLMAVSPAAQRGGIGAALFEEILARAEARGITLVLLDASAAGAPLYRRYGFVDQGEAIAYHVDRESGREPMGHESGRVAAYPLSALSDDYLDAVCAFDTAAYGADRTRLVVLYARADPSRMMVALDEDEKVAGYAVAQSRSVGPVVASDAAVADTLIRRALAVPFDTQSVSLLVAGQNAQSIELMAARHDVVRDRTLRHMRKGDPCALASDWSRIYAKGSFAVG